MKKLIAGLVVILCSFNMNGQEGVTLIVKEGFSWNLPTSGPISRVVYRAKEDGISLINNRAVCSKVMNEREKISIKFDIGFSSVGNYNWTDIPAGYVVWTYGESFNWIDGGDGYEYVYNVFLSKCGNPGTIRRPKGTPIYIDRPVTVEADCGCFENEISDLKAENEALKFENARLKRCLETVNRTFYAALNYYAAGKSSKKAFNEAQAQINAIYQQDPDCFMFIPQLTKISGKNWKYGVGFVTGLVGGWFGNELFSKSKPGIASNNGGNVDYNPGDGESTPDFNGGSSNGNGGGNSGGNTGGGYNRGSGKSTLGKMMNTAKYSSSSYGGSFKTSRTSRR